MDLEQLTIRPAEAGDQPAWRALWSQYCAFYEVTISDAVTIGTWARILDESSPVKALVAINSVGEIVGFANYVLHLHTWSEKTLCYLEDLFVAPEARGANTGYALIERLIEMGGANDWARVHWHTAADNTRARRLYDRFIPADNMVHYAVKM